MSTALFLLLAAVFLVAGVCFIDWAMPKVHKRERVLPQWPRRRRRDYYYS